MQYLLLIYENEAESAARSPQEMQGMLADYQEFTHGIVASGNFRGGEALRPVSTATSVRVRQGKVILTDGPFAETHEQLGGFYLIEAPDLDAATAIASRIPAAKTGTIEVRPLQVWNA